jgi:hypothetical protein
MTEKLYTNVDLFRHTLHEVINFFKYLEEDGDDERQVEFKQHAQEPLYTHFTRALLYLFKIVVEPIMAIILVLSMAITKVLRRDASLTDMKEKEYNTFLMNVMSSIEGNHFETLIIKLYIKVLKDEAFNANQVEELFSNPELTSFNVFYNYTEMFMNTMKHNEIYKDSMLVIADLTKVRGVRYNLYRPLSPTVCEFVVPLLPLMELTSAIDWGILMHQQGSAISTRLRDESKALCTKMMEDHYDEDPVHISDMFDMMCQTAFGPEQIQKFLDLTMHSHKKRRTS